MSGGKLILPPGVRERDLILSDITDRNVSTSKHGFQPKLPNDATKYMDGTGAYSVPGVSGGAGNIVIAYRNAGVSQLYVSVPSNSAFNIGNPSKFTVRMWMMPIGSNTNNGLASRGPLNGTTSGDWSLGFFNGTSQRLTFRVNNAGGSIQSATDLIQGKWYFVEASYDSSLGSNNLKLFINGTLDTQGNYSTVVTNNANPLRVGAYFDASHDFIGYISEFEFCAGVVRNTGAYTPTARLTPDANTTVHFSFDEYWNAGVTDDSGNGFNGSVVGTVTVLDTAFRKL